MKDFVMIHSKDYVDIGQNQRIYVFKDVEEYEDQIQIMIEKNINLSELEKMVESWGGSMKIYFLNNLIKNFEKNNQ
jgi:hypothetical protein